MSTVASVPQDRPFIVGALSAFTVYATYDLAQAAAISLSASNSSAAVYTAQIYGIATNTAATAEPPGGRFDLEPGNPQAWIIQLASTATYLPLATAIAQAFTTSAANSNEAVAVARTFQTCTGP